MKNKLAYTLQKTYIRGFLLFPLVFLIILDLYLPILLGIKHVFYVKVYLFLLIPFFFNIGLITWSDFYVINKKFKEYGK